MEITKIILTNEGFAVTTAETAEEAMLLFKENRFDLVLLDSWLPDVPGHELCRTLRELNDRTPIVFYTAAAYDADKARAFACGAQGYLVKPAGNDELIEMLRAVLEGKR